MTTAIVLRPTGFAKRVDTWLLTPRPQRFTELYFTDHSQLPATVTAGRPQDLPFTIHNLEHQNITYHYRLIAMPDNGNVEHRLGEGTFTLAHNQLRTIHKVFVLPAVSGRTTVKVSLSYQGMAGASNVPALETQSIHWRITIAHHSGDEQPRG